MCRAEGCCLPPPLCPANMPSHQLIQPTRPRLPRQLTTSARINLNKYWHVLGELMPASRRILDEADSNAINENIDNERRLAAMQLSMPETSGHPSGSGKTPPNTSSFPSPEVTVSAPPSGTIQASSSRLPDDSSIQMAVEASSDENTPPSVCTSMEQTSST